MCCREWWPARLSKELWISHDAHPTAACWPTLSKHQVSIASQLLSFALDPSWKLPNVAMQWDPISWGPLLPLHLPCHCRVDLHSNMVGLSAWTERHIDDPEAVWQRRRFSWPLHPGSKQKSSACWTWTSHEGSITRPALASATQIAKWWTLTSEADTSGCPGQSSHVSCAKSTTPGMVHCRCTSHVHFQRFPGKGTWKQAPSLQGLLSSYWIVDKLHLGWHPHSTIRVSFLHSKTPGVGHWQHHASWTIEIASPPTLWFSKWSVAVGIPAIPAQHWHPLENQGLEWSWACTSWRCPNPWARDSSDKIQQQ